MKVDWKELRDGFRTVSEALLTVIMGILAVGSFVVVAYFGGVAMVYLEEKGTPTTYLIVGVVLASWFFILQRRKPFGYS